MASKSFQALKTSIAEIYVLRELFTRTTGIKSGNPELIRAVGRSAIVLLYSHFEKYTYSVNEEIADFLNVNNVEGNSIPEMLRLLHSKTPVEKLAEMQWIHRATTLKDFISTDYWLWTNNQNGKLIPDRLLEWMKSPNPDNITRYFRYWDIDDIFSRITKTSHIRSYLWTQIQTLVDKRNNIAHGDATTECSKSELGLCSRAVLIFCERADRILSRQIRRLFLTPAPW